MRSVFISHSNNDPDWPVALVVDLASRLRERGLQVHLDEWLEQELHIDPGPEIFRAWMKACLAEDPLLLFLGSPLYVQRFKRDPQEPSGRGVAFESVDFERRLSVHKQRNDGWLWCAIPDGSDPAAYVPTDLKDHCSPYPFPAAAHRLLEHLVHHATKTDPVAPKLSKPVASSATALTADPPLAIPGQTTLAAQRQWAADRLADAPDFFTQLRRDHWAQRPPNCLAKGDADQLASWLCAADASACDTTLLATRRALGKLPAKADRDTRLAAERAAVAMYCLAACRRVALAAGALASREGLVTVPSDAPVYCAVIATVLSGGRLELQPSPQHAGMPGPAYSFDVQGAPTGDGAPYAFDRAVYAAVFPNAERTPYFALDHQPLSNVEVEQLRARLKTLRSVKEQAVTLVVRVGCARDQADAFGRAHDLPVFICDPALAKDVLGVDADALVADLAEFWRELSELPSQPAPPAQ